MRVVAIGDIHGSIKPFLDLLKKTNLSREDKLILLGDYIDRGPSAKQVLNKILELIEEGYNVIPILGNHERMMLNSFLNHENYTKWMINGGWATLESFSCESIHQIPSKYIDLLSSLPHYHKHNKFLFVHAGFNENIDSIYTDTESMLWIRKEEYDSNYFNEKIVIHGHTPSPLKNLKIHITNSPQVINLDTGCAYSGKYGLGYLTALCINNYELFWIENK